MLFNSLEFLIFLPIVFLLYWFVFHKRQWQNLLVVVASYVFYGWWDWRFLILIVITSLSSYASGLLIERYAGCRQKQRWVNVANIVLNLGILGTFKYYNFFVENLAHLVGTLGYQLDCVTLQIILPVGISFYTFQALSYSIDVYQKRLPATHNAVEFFAYISFFPQLVAGPIERATHLLPQFQRQRHFDYALAVDGCRQMLWGFFKKLVIADHCAVVVSEYWDSYAQLPGTALILLAILFTIQIYCDFSGYSDIAIGCARLFGINLTRNFDNPYFSRSMPEFWRRWHISLISWFRDYIYIPLGGNRGKKWETIRNVYIIWTISGLWHGANWTFICWGLYHGTLLAICNLLDIHGKEQNNLSTKRLFPGFKAMGQMILTFALATIGWTIFRAESMPQAVDFFTALLTNRFYDPSMTRGVTIAASGFALLFIEWLQRDKQHTLQFTGSKPFSYPIVRWSIYYLLLLLIDKYSGDGQTFIYFQF